jgi:spore coat-associated protein N
MGLSLTTTTGKVLASLALVGTAAGVAGLGTYGAFVSTTEAHTKVATGTVTIALTPGAGDGLNLAAQGLVPGDRIQRTVNLNNTGTADFGTVTLTTSASPSSILVDPAKDGLQMVIESCPVAWVETTSLNYGCNGTPITVLGHGPVVRKAELMHLKAIEANNWDFLRVTMTLPDAADQNFAGLESTIKFNFTATQRAGINK